MVAPHSFALAALLALHAGQVMASSASGATTSALHPMRFLDTTSTTTTTPSSSSMLTSSTIVIEPSRRFLTDFEATIRRELHGFKSTTSSNDINNHPANLRALQTEELTFEDVCGFLVQIINEGSEGAIVCSCEAETNTLSCLTPTPVCENTLTNICASLSLNITFLDNFGADMMGVCVNYTGVSDPSGPFRDGCVSADFADDGTTIESCVASFDDANGVRTDCTTCTGCGNVTTGAGFSLDCSNLYPGATTNGCYTTGGTAQQASALFPAAEEYENGNSTNGGSGGGTTGGGSIGNGTVTDGGNGGGSSGGSGSDGGSGGGPTTAGNGTITDDDTAGDTEDDAEGQDGDGDGGSGTNGTDTGTGSGSGSGVDAAAGTSAGSRTSVASGALTLAGIAALSSFFLGMLAAP